VYRRESEREEGVRGVASRSHSQSRPGTGSASPGVDSGSAGRLAWGLSKIAWVFAVLTRGACLADGDLDGDGDETIT
jgi:hypothetical protein